MLIDTISELIQTVAKEKNPIKLAAIRDIKTHLTKEQTSGLPYTDDVETKTMIKMVKEYKTAIEEFKKINTTDSLNMAKEYEVQLNIIQEFAPKEATNEDIIALTKSVIVRLIVKNGPISMKDMKTIQNEVKKTYPTADGKLISTVVRENI